jgi:hypothetical protein
MTPITSPDSRSVIRKLNFPGGKVRWIHFSVNEMESLVLVGIMVLGRTRRRGVRGLCGGGHIFLRRSSSIDILNLYLEGISGCFSITRSLGRTFWWFG